MQGRQSMWEKIDKYVLRLFEKDKYVGAERIVLGKWFQRNGAA